MEDVQVLLASKDAQISAMDAQNKSLIRSQAKAGGIAAKSFIQNQLKTVDSLRAILSQPIGSISTTTSVNKLVHKGLLKEGKNSFQFKQIPKTVQSWDALSNKFTIEIAGCSEIIAINCGVNRRADGKEYANAALQLLAAIELTPNEVNINTTYECSIIHNVNNVTGEKTYYIDWSSFEKFAKIKELYLVKETPVNAPETPVM